MADTYDFSGLYEGEIEGVKTSLHLNQSGPNLTGDLNKGGLLYNIVGIADSESIQGRMNGTDNIETYMLQAEINNGLLIIHLISHDLETRTISKDTFVFNKIESENLGHPNHATQKLITDSEFHNDRALFGTWAREEILGRSDSAISTQVVIELDSEGNYKLLGAVNLKGTSDTGYSGDTTQGKWRTHNGTFYTLVSGSKYWKPYAKYKLENKNQMTFILEDGERQNWVKSDL